MARNKYTENDDIQKNQKTIWTHTTISSITIGATNRKVIMKPIHLVARNRVGAGFEIYADLPEETNCIEFTLKAAEVPIVKGTDSEYVTKQWTTEVKLNTKNVTIGFEPFIQFPEDKWKDMIEETFVEMVKLWNEKHSTKPDDQ